MPIQPAAPIHPGWPAAPVRIVAERAAAIQGIRAAPALGGQNAVTTSIHSAAEGSAVPQVETAAATFAAMRAGHVRLGADVCERRLRGRHSQQRQRVSSELLVRTRLRWERRLGRVWESLGAYSQQGFCKRVGSSNHSRRRQDRGRITQGLEISMFKYS